MNAALKSAQANWDNRQPPVMSDGEAERIWVDNAAEDLLRGADVKFKRRGHAEQGVTFEQFTGALDEFAVGRLADPDVGGSAFGLLIWSARRSPAEASAPAGDLLGADPDEAMREIARTLLAPLAGDGLIAEAEGAD